MSYGADVIPYVGTVKGIQETITGVNYITGEQLSVGDRIENGVGTLTSLIPIPGAKYVGKYGTEGVIDAGDWVLKQFGKKTIKNVNSFPSVRKIEFNNWFNSLTSDEFDQVWANPKLRDTIEDRLRHPRGLHEWHLVSRANVFKRWGDK
ncbi:pre-toxin TG domain-containing protein [Paenibacillus sp. PsM32]|uniref:pre-toxin TG domain-containing protein n=1 Tax=Paenibacillus sp. PsM32 TaxID=3030536 RepID=UPI00263A3E36|nr:pre-toxin TG domain-containing protein [Paenibacillus sp. PsM32]MDN4621057.1 pre-toxin TG domain-containing protein [Paenibacillus sp. PsM32]